MNSPIKVAVLGALGRMGAVTCQSISQDSDLCLVAKIDKNAKPNSANSPDSDGSYVYSSLDSALEDKSDFEVAVDFTQADAAEQHLEILAKNAVHTVVGTSGIDSNKLDHLSKIFQKSNCIIAPNFSISAVLAMKMAEIAAPFFDSAEIVEMHHAQKIDAPSGTALETLRRMEEASNKWNSDPTQKENLANARGAKGESGIRVHSLRIEGMVAHQEIILGTQGQTISIRQDSYDRTSFMPGVLLAIKNVGKHPGVTLGLDKILGI